MAEPPPDAAISQADALNYWTSVSADNEGMLGGFPQVSRIDLRSSTTFMAKLRRRAQEASKQPPGAKPEPLGRAVDCGAGIGRVTAGLLVHLARVVDVVEPVARFTAAVSDGPGFAALRGEGRIGHVYTAGLESWTPAHQYDLVWNQWCLGQLRDAQLVAYFRRCRKHLSQGGWIVVKENLSTDAQGQDIFDDVDSSVTRSDAKFRKLFEQAGLRIVAMDDQKGFPQDLFPVRTYALRPDDS